MNRPPCRRSIRDGHRWEYDAGGLISASCDTTAPATSCASGGASVNRTIVPNYDALGRVTKSDTYAGASVTLALETRTDYFRDGQPQELRYYEGTTPTLKDTIDLGYDTAGRQTTLTRGGTTIASQTWNATGTVHDRTDGDAGALGQSTFAYDWANRLTGVTEPAGFGGAASFTWRADGLMATRKWTAAGTAATFSYDAAKRVTGLTMGTRSLAQTYDAAGNVLTESRSFPSVSGDAGSGTQTFLYDALNRVKGSSGLSAASSRSYTYDRDGNRLTKVAGTFPSSTTFTAELDRTDELIAVTKSGGTRQTFAYDARGNMTTDVEDGVTAIGYAYDLGNKLTTIDAPGGSANDAAFTFDALGRNRTRVLAGGATTDTYSYLGGTESVVRIANSGGTTTDSLVDAAGQRLGVKVGTTVNWFVPDPHGSIAGSLTADETKLSNAIRYDAYGETLATAAQTSAPAAVGEKTWKHQGRLDLSPTGLATPLYDAGARDYAPGLGAFTSLDTVMGSAQDPLSMNRFLYAAANPATLIDPDGHCYRYIDDFCADKGVSSTARVRHFKHTSNNDRTTTRKPFTPLPKGGAGALVKPSTWRGASDADPARTWGSATWLAKGQQFVDEVYDYPIQTRGLCLGASTGLAGGAGGSMCYVKQPDGTEATLVNLEAGGASAVSASAPYVVTSAGLSTYTSNGTIADQAGAFSTTGISGGKGPLSAGVDLSVGFDGKTTATQLWATGTKNQSVLPLEFHSYISNTWVSYGGDGSPIPPEYRLMASAYADLGYLLDRMFGYAHRSWVPTGGT